MLSKAVLIAFTVVPMISSFFSIMGSSTILVMISKSRKKFSDPYRRLIFGISFYDLIQSITFIFKIFRTTPEQPNAWIALGNQTSCSVLGWMHFAGLNGTLLYNVALNIYYLCLVRFNMTARKYKNRVEPFLHAIPNLWAIISASTLAGTGHLNPAYAGECLIAPYPINCLKKNDVECIRGENTNLYRLLFRVIPTFVAFFVCVFTLGLLWWTVESQEKRMNQYRMSMVSLRLRTSINNELGPGPRRLQKTMSSVRSLFKGNSDTDVTKNNPKYRRRRHQGRVFLAQARWYVLAFLLTHVCPIVVVSAEWGGNKPPIWVLMVAKVLVPLQGLLNIVVYTRPHVAKIRVRDSSLSYWAAFRKVVSSGGDDDDEKNVKRFRRGAMPEKVTHPAGGRLNRLSNNSSRSASSGRKSQIFLSPPFGLGAFGKHKNETDSNARRSSVKNNQPENNVRIERKSSVSFRESRPGFEENVNVLGLPVVDYDDEQDIEFPLGPLSPVGPLSQTNEWTGKNPHGQEQQQEDLEECGLELITQPQEKDSGDKNLLHVQEQQQEDSENEFVLETLAQPEENDSGQNLVNVEEQNKNTDADGEEDIESPRQPLAREKNSDVVSIESE